MTSPRPPGDRSWPDPRHARAAHGVKFCAAGPCGDLYYTSGQLKTSNAHNGAGACSDAKSEAEAAIGFTSKFGSRVGRSDTRLIRG